WHGCSSFFFFSSRRRHTRWPRDWSSDVCSSDLIPRRRRNSDRRGRRRCRAARTRSPAPAGGGFPRRAIRKETPAGDICRETAYRSEERRVGKECRCRGSTEHEEKNEDGEKCGVE